MLLRFSRINSQLHIIHNLYIYLLAYCTPPNPCPVGYEEDQGCQKDFENTAAFSRDYQAAQECMCDGEHMFDCSEPKESKHSNRQLSSDLGSFIARQFQNGDGKGFVAKKFYNFRVSICIAQPKILKLLFTTDIGITAIEFQTFQKKI